MSKPNCLPDSYTRLVMNHVLHVLKACCCCSHRCHVDYKIHCNHNNPTNVIEPWREVALFGTCEHHRQSESGFLTRFLGGKK